LPKWLCGGGDGQLAWPVGGSDSLASVVGYYRINKG
jgi:hypothetical protein